MRDATARRFYNGRLWRDTRQFVLSRDQYTCADCGGHAEEVHHIIPLTADNITDTAIALNPTNLISLCHNCHTKRTAGAGDTSEAYRFDEYGQVVPM